jgi:hypothetical protein
MKSLTLTVLLFTAPLLVSAQKRLPIIDMHLHAHTLEEYAGGGPVCTNDQKIMFPGVDPLQPITLDRTISCPAPLPAAATDEAVMKESLALLERYNIWAVTSGSLDQVTIWRASAPRRIIPAISFATSRPGPRTPVEFRQLFSAGKFLFSRRSARSIRA